MPRYNPALIEPKWQKYWEKHQTFKTPDLPAGPKLYVLDMFPYPSGDGLHVGHPEGYTATDIVCRFGRMQGKSVLHPMGFDAFGLPAEEHAIKTNTPPRESTERNIANFRRQLKMLGFSYDWDRELATTDVDYFRWTQWIFLTMFDTWFDPEQGKGRPISELPIPADVAQQGQNAIRQYQDQQRLAYQADALVNWCPALGTVLANEEVKDGKSERGGHPVQRLPLRQWMLRITAYADRLEKDLDTLRWPESIKQMQRDWIGRSVGAEVDFYIGDRSRYADWRAKRSQSGYPRKPGDEVLRIYTTRPDTLFGASYMVIAPEHPFVERLTTPEQKAAVEAYCARAAARSDRERQEDKEKTGVFTGSSAVNPVNDQEVPIWISDYVLITYGTGAIMAVPAHDTRDFEFAERFQIPVIAVVDPGDAPGVDREAVLAGRQCCTEDGVAVNSGKYDGLKTAAFKQKISDDLAAAGLGREAVNYKLRDWLFSRQRFWGEPFPILHELDEQGQPTGCLRAVPDDELPVDLPPLDDFKPHGRPEPPLAKAPEEWLYPEIDGRTYRRETNTMPQWAGSCWYYLRYIDPRNEHAAFDTAKEKYWMPVDLYVGGAEHAVLHLLYARFWHKVLFDLGYVSTREPFQKLVNQGMILGISYKDARGALVPMEQVVHRTEGAFHAETGEKLTEFPAKMSKSLKNVVNPEDVIREYGADSMRLYEMFMGPLEAVKPWNTKGVEGVFRFLKRSFRMVAEQPITDAALDEAQRRLLHATIKKVTDDLETMSFNTAISQMMIFINAFSGHAKPLPREAAETYVLLLAPFAPHLCEELWERLGHDTSLAYAPWPKYNEEYLRVDEVEILVQVLGKPKARVMMPAGADEATMRQLALEQEAVRDALAGKTVRKVICVPGRLINIVAG